MTRKRLNGAIGVIALAGGMGSAFKCAWFFAFFSYNMGSSGPLVALVLYLPFVIAPYVLIWFAERRCPTGYFETAILVVAILCLLTSSVYYIDGLPRVQDGEFAIVFMLAVPQTLIAAVCLVVAVLLHRKYAKSASNITVERDGPQAARSSL